ncbi:F-box protein: endocytic membrane traffic, recycling ReCYcling 1 [Pleurotus ostreatus]|uniref:F-box protein: endocytic membrane traffic, recycling ReCYcling 1 n=1 Tax=Pleurotus ostreatus TaxID=5322 RepID=A0A8H6ZW61_PLEOS|nr:F-box protein: endocytic membrane traffic, recycling ReCYcling 1 [Pleurotus ostreatus]KAF7430450.1 F-box protein: endocytic membrane traffic, recycling ReCYcling 1 [Pleurotus ostreatus]
MDKFATLEPVRLYNATTSASARLLSRGQGPKPAIAQPLVGRLPSDLHLLILAHLAVPDFPAYSRCSHATAALAQDEKIWQARWAALAVDKYALSDVLDELEANSKGKTGAIKSAAPPTLEVDDEFGEFASVDIVNNPPIEEMGDFVGGGFDDIARMVLPTPQLVPTRVTPRTMYMRAHRLLKPLTTALSAPPHMVLSALAANSTSSLRSQAKALHLLSCWLSPRIQPLRKWDTLFSSLRAAMDRFDSNALTAFDIADEHGDEDAMREAAESSWEVWDRTGDWEMGKVWAEKREIFYEQGNWEPLDNSSAKDGVLDFDAMDEFMTHVLEAIRVNGSLAVRVFPPASEVLLNFADRLATDVVGEYITALLTRAREVSNDTFLKAAAATFREAWRMVDAMQAASVREDSAVSKTRAEDVVYQMFEPNMDEYLDEEVESTKHAFEVICKAWEKGVSSGSIDASISVAESTSQARFLGSHNPAQVKRNVLASFTSVLLLPVTIVPRTVGAVGAALTTGGSAAVQGISMLNPQRWGGSAPSDGYSKKLDQDGGALFEVGDDDEDAPTRSSGSISTSTTTTAASARQVAASTNFDLLLSLDVSLELIHADREALKRVETFAGYPGHYGHRVRDTIEEIFILFLQILSERHVIKGFSQAILQITSYKPADHEDTTSVAPLVQFFELVHIGDTIQSMVQVYFDKELAPHIDKTDFLNAVVREKKRFENSLDDSVAAGLNAGTELLMNQVEHIITKLTKPREYYPPEDAPLDLGPTLACTEAIKCLDMHCKLLKGSTSKEVLEVFYQEVGIRLIAILQKHIKRQIISLSGGFQVIADLNTYHTFIASLKVQTITSEFSHLKMLGHVFVVEDAKDLAQIVRDVTRYGGAYRPEDIYEFVQRRSDWKKIEKIVDKTMYNLSFKEDCVIC